jgi:hypothetical protein
MDRAPSSLELVGAPESLSFPELCAHCGSPSERRLLIERRLRKRPRGASGAFRRVAVRVPFCRACLELHRRQRPALSARQLLRALGNAHLLLPAMGCAAIAIGLGVALQNHGFASGRMHTALTATSLLLGLLSLLAFRAAWRQLRTAIARPTQVTDAFEFSGDLSTPFQRERHRYSLTNPIFAGAFETCNLRRRWDATSRSTRWSASLRNRVLAIICFAALGFWLITWIER